MTETLFVLSSRDPAGFDLDGDVSVGRPGDVAAVGKSGCQVFVSYSVCLIALFVLSSRDPFRQLFVPTCFKTLSKAGQRMLRYVMMCLTFRISNARFVPQELLPIVESFLSLV